jgi:outer membrane protein TolC
MKFTRLAMPFFILLLGGCAVYRAKPLDLNATLPSRIPRLTVDLSRLHVPHLTPHRFDPSNGLDGTEVAMLAVANNPELKLARDKAGITGAQAFAAGLLPDPQVDIGADFPTNGISGSSSTATSVGLSYDFESLITHRVAKAAAHAKLRQADLELLWQDWQVASRARQLYTRTLEQNRLMRLLKDERNLLANRYRHIHQALQEGNATVETADTDLAALQDAERRINDLQRTNNSTHHDLNQLLGISPDIDLPLVGEASAPPLNATKVKALVARLASRRPDLLALQAGYRSGDLAYRRAILEQFPALNVGLTRASDTSNVHTIGFSVSMNLPLFNRNRGQIAVTRADRQRLYDEFETRLMQARADISKIMADQKLLERQRTRVLRGISLQEKAVADSEAAFRAGNIDEMTYVALRTSLIKNRIELNRLDQTILDQRIALQTLLGSDLSGAAKR